MDPVMTGPDGTTYTLAEWRNQHIVGVAEASIPGGKTVYSPRCSCAGLDVGHCNNREQAKRVADEHKRLVDLMEEL